MSVKPKLECTNKWDLFQGHDHNRCDKLKPELIESMRKYGFLPSGAIHVRRIEGGKFEVIRGHHRWLTAKHLGIPLWYIVDETVVDRLEDLETSGQDWTVNDHVKSKSIHNDDYLALLEFQKKYRLPIGVAANLLSGVCASSKKIKSGNFKISGDTTIAETVAKLSDILFDIGIKFSKSSGFLDAVSRCLRVPEFDLNILKQKAQNFPKHMIKRGTSNEYLEEIERLYNYASRKPIPLAFRAKEIGNQIKAKFFTKKEDKGDLVQATLEPTQAVEIQTVSDVEASDLVRFFGGEILASQQTQADVTFQAVN